MATYYVRTDGSNSNTGTGSGTGAAWATVAHALGGTGTASGVVGGDVIYIAPGRYTGVTVGISPSSVVSVIGDPSSAQFGGAIPAGPIHITNNTNDRATYSGSPGFTLSSRNNFSFSNLVIGGISSTTSHNLTFDKCFVYGFNGSAGASAGWTFSANTNANLLVKNCAFYQFANRTIEITCANHSSSYTSTIRFENSYIQAYSTFAMNNATGLIFTNCNTSSINVTGTVVSSAVYQNSIITLGGLSGSVGGNFVEDYNVFNNSTRSNVASGSNSVTTGNVLNYGDYMTITGTQTMPMLSPPSTVFNQLIGYGTTTNAPATDYYGATYGTPMTVGPVKSQTLTGAGIYQATERNASSTAITGNSTSQSIELYLGVTGLTATTNGLTALYNRTRTASVNIPLVSRTITQPWISGGFAEVDPVGMPGVYRLDLPNEAISSGAEDCTIVVKGASGTNGAVINIRLERQTTLISTTSYKLISDQMGANGILDVIKGSSITVKLQMVDVNNKPIPIGTAACTVEVYSINNLVETYPTVIQYQSNGELTFVLDTQVTATPGTYNIYVVRNNGGSDTVLYGPMKLVVSNL